MITICRCWLAAIGLLALSLSGQPAGPKDQEAVRKWLAEWDGAVALNRSLPAAVAANHLRALANMLPPSQPARRVSALREAFEVSKRVPQLYPATAPGATTDSLEGFLTTRLERIDRQSLQLTVIKRMRKADQRQALLLIDQLSSAPARELACTDGAIPSPEKYYRELFQYRPLFPNPVLGKVPYASFLTRKLEPNDLYAVAAMLREFAPVASGFRDEEYQAVTQSAIEALRRIPPSARATTNALATAIGAVRTMIRARGRASWSDEDLALALRAFLLRSPDEGVCGDWAFSRVEGKAVAGFLTGFNALAAELKQAGFQKVTPIDVKEVKLKVGGKPRFNEFWQSKYGWDMMSIMKRLHSVTAREERAKLIEEGLRHVRLWEPEEPADVHAAQRSMAANALLQAASTPAEFRAAAQLVLEALRSPGFIERCPGIWNWELGALQTAQPGRADIVRQLMAKDGTPATTVQILLADLYRSRPGQ